MANTTFNGPVRSENGFETVSINSSTGAVTTTASFGATTSITSLTTASATISGAATVGTTLGVTGMSTLTGGLIGGVQSLSGAGAVNLTTVVTALTTTGAAQALTLANGTAGQIKVIVHVVDGGSAVLTPTTPLGFSTMTFTNAGDSITLVYTAAGWAIIGNRGGTIA